MEIKRYCQVIGAFFLAIGILGFIPGVSLLPAHHMDASASGMLFGIFPVNALHNLVHIAFGVWAFYAAKTIDTSRVFCSVSAVVYGVLAVFGLLPGLNTLYGLIPLYGNMVWLHAVIAVASAYYAWAWHRRTVRLGV